MWPFRKGRRTLPPPSDQGLMLLHEMRELRHAITNLGDLLTTTNHELQQARLNILVQEHRTLQLESKVAELESLFQ